MFELCPKNQFGLRNKALDFQSSARYQILRANSDSGTATLLEDNHKFDFRMRSQAAL